MKIAFVGKGGSGKSTLTSLFIRYLQEQGKQNILAIDADLNMNLSGLLGVNVPTTSLLANPDVAEAIRHYLKGTNSRIEDVSKFLPTTPPGTGSNLIKGADESALAPYMVRISEQPSINLLTVGSYDREGIGQTCYHSHLFVAENLLSHTITSPKFGVVCDMVAGTDAFAYSMHLQFDAIILIAEPTPESTEVCKQYLDLARESGIEELIHLVGNKVEDEDDINYISKHVTKKPVATVPSMPKLKKARQSGEPVDASILNASLIATMRTIENKAMTPSLSVDSRMNLLYRLHKKLNTKKWVELGYGDVGNQIDPNFHPYNKTEVLV